jgi:DNA primase
MPNPGSFADMVKQQADIVRIIGDYVRLKKTGAQNFGGLCPFHKEKSPSFSVHATRQFYHCFGCGVSGDVFSFVQKVENITFPEAVRAVAQKLGIQAPKQSYSPEEAREAQLRTALVEMHERACGFFEEQLRRPEGAKAREYLTGRGLDQETIRTFRIGYAPDSGFVLRDLFRGADEQLLRDSGLFSWKEKDGGNERPTAPAGPTTSDQRPTTASRPTTLYSKFRDRIIFPICNETGKVIAFTGRRLSADEKSGPKYLNSPETAIYSKSRVLFNLDKAKEHIRALGYAILVEGQMDCIAVFTAGFKNVIASSGTAFTEAQVRLLARHSRNVVVNFDPDTAGAAAAERSLGLLVEEDFQIKVVTLEQGLDPDLFIRQRGNAEYAAALNRAPLYFSYLVERARALHPPRSAENKAKAVNYLLPHLNRIPNRIVRDELAADMAQKLGIDSAVLRQELRRVVAARSGTVKSPAEPAITDAERILVRALHPADEQGSEMSRRLAEVIDGERLHEGLGTEPLISASIAGSDAELTQSQRTQLAAILMCEDEPLSTELVQGAVHALRRRRLERMQRELRTRIVEAERRQDSGSLPALLQEKLRVDRELAGSNA